MRSFLAAGALLAACTPHPPKPMVYPPMPAAPSASSTPDAFDPDAHLSKLTLACRKAELEPANGLDDDCDGSIDGRADSLLIAVAYPRATRLSLSLRDDHANARPLTPACGESFCVAYTDAEGLSRGRHALWVGRPDPGTAPEPHALVVSVQLRGKVMTYLARLDEGEKERVLGSLALP